jgi:hypothetical protein
MGKTKVVQLNKQTTIVKVKMKSSCNSRKKRRPVCIKKKRLTCIAMLCGDIFQPCDEESQTYFTSLHPRDQAFIRLANDSHCRMRATIEGISSCIEQSIEQGQQISFYVPHLQKLLIACEQDGCGVCMGRYEIRLYR